MSSIVECEEEELTFCHGEPEDVCCSPYPEKVVLGFYHNFTAEKAPRYFTDIGWKNSGECASGQCGCISARSEISRVQVLKLEPQEETSNPNKDISPDQATVGVTIRCEKLSGVRETERSMRWHLIHKDGHWLLDRQE